MKILRWIARFFCSTVIFVLGLYTVFAAAIAFFILTGTLVPGQPMIFEETTPSLAKTLIFVAAGSAVIAGFALARSKLAEPANPPAA